MTNSRARFANHLRRILVGCSVAVVAVGLAAPAHAAPTGGPVNDQGCTPLKPTTTRLIGADGNTVSALDAAAAHNAATEYTYIMPDGTTMSTIVPPQDFRPQNATPATARAFGFDAPDDPAALSAWQDRYKGYTGTIASVPCVAPPGKTSQRTIFSNIWGGYLATGHSNYVQVSDRQNVPTFSTACGSNQNTMTSSWIGIGGVNTDRLIQQGLDSGSSSTATNGARLWYEYLTNAHPNPLVYVGSVANSVDIIYQNLVYSSGSVTFYWFDQNTGQTWSPARISGVTGYYDGSSVEFITERVTPLPLRKFDQITFSSATATYGTTSASLFNLPVTHVQLTDDGTFNGSLDSDTSTSSNSFHQNFIKCS